MGGYALGVPALSFYLVWRKRRTLHTQYARNSVGFLYLGYSDRCYYYESVVLLKKVLFGAVILMARVWRPQVLGVLSIALFLAAYVLHMEQKPFEEEPVDRLERLSAVAVLALLLSGLLFAEEGALDETWRTCLTAAVAALNLVVVATAALLMAGQWSRRENAEEGKEKKAVEMAAMSLPVRSETLNPLQGKGKMGR